MSAMNTPQTTTSRQMRKPRPIFVEALLTLILAVVEPPFMAWLNFPAYIHWVVWVVVAAFAVYVFITILFRRQHSSDVKS